MSTLYIRLPSRAVAERAAHWVTLLCPYAVISNDGSIARQGRSGLSDLTALIGASQRVVLLLAASDVTLLQINVPPLSPARLRLALPNLVEDQLISDPGEAVIVAGHSKLAVRPVAVVQRAWLQILLQTLVGYGARNLTAIPSQLCLTQPDAGAVPANVAAVTEFEADIDLTIRLMQNTPPMAMGLPMSFSSTVATIEATVQATAHEVVQTVCALAPTASVALYVPAEQLATYQSVVQELLPLEQRMTVLTDQWPCWIPGPEALSLNLIAGLRGAVNAGANWSRWRWPLTLGALVLALNIAALNFQWWRLSREATQLRASMVQIYRTAYPKETVIVDPIAQMRQKIAAAQRGSGKASVDDFTALAAGFGVAWAEVTQNAQAANKPAIESIEFRDRSLLVKPKSQPAVPLAQLRSALATRNLTLSQSAPGIWQIRSSL